MEFITGGVTAAKGFQAAAAAAEENNLIEWKLSDRELDIIKNLNK